MSRPTIRFAPACSAVDFGWLAFSACLLAWTTFMFYDDEGYVLFSLKNFAEVGGLYDRVYSQYGPFFFLFRRGLHALGLEFTNNSARVLGVCYWLGTSAVCGLLVWR